MANKDFEQQVRDGLQDWRIEPPERVWTSVSEAIQKRRKRRALIWFPLAALLVGAGLWGMVKFVKHYTYREGMKPPLLTTVTPLGVHGNRAHGDALHGNGIQTLPNTADKWGQIQGNGPSAMKNPSLPIAIATKTMVMGKTSHYFLAYAGQDSNLTQNLNTVPTLWGGKPIVPQLTTRKTSLKEPKWALRAYAGAGLASQGLFIHEQTRTTYYTASAGLVANPGNTSNYTKVLAARKVGAGWEGGIDYQYPLSRRWHAGIGLTYDHWQTEFDKVENVNGVLPYAYLLSASSNTNYYEGGSGKPYVNTYQWVQVPLRITWSITPLRAWNPSFFMGATIGYMVANNALSYSTTVAYQHAPPDLFRHWTAYWQGGLECHVGHIGNYRFFTGPVFQYDLSSLQAGAVPHDHLNYAGIRLGLALDRKNNP